MRLALLTLLLAASASAQPAPDSTEVGQIVGMVIDAGTGGPLIGANVYLPGLQRGVSTGIDGRLVIDRVPVGTYDVTMAYVGYGPVTLTGVEVRAGEEIEVRADLQADLLCDCVVVFAKPEAISRGVYQARVVSYQHWESSCCTVWVERDAVPSQRWESR